MPGQSEVEALRIVHGIIVYIVTNGG